jgi:hypothetical protein
MGFKKGVSGNPTGRPIGSKNKTTEEIREKISDFLNEVWPQVQTDFKELDPEKRMFFYEKLLKYSIPPLQSISMQAEIKSDLDRLSDDQLAELADRLIELNTEDDEN